MRYSSLALVFAFASVAPAEAAVVNLNDWTAESYEAVASFGAGVWTPAADGSSVTQSVNGQPTLYYSDFTAYGTKVTGKIRVATSGGDDDFVGFVIGYDPGDVTNSGANYLLIDWKRATQSFDFGAPSTTPGGVAQIGLAVSRVTGVPTADEFWQHTNHASHTGGGVSELARGATLGATGWDFNTEYEFTFDFGPNDLEVYVNGVKQIDITGSFANGRLGFYNFSQAAVTYSAFTVDEGTFPEDPEDPEDPPTNGVPEPGMLGLLGLGVAVIALRRRR